MDWILDSFSKGEVSALNIFLYASLATGIFKLLKTAYSLFCVVSESYLYSPVNFNRYGANSGKWAVITGASDGIGKEYAFQLAKRGFNIVMVSRTQSKLEAVSQEIESKYKTNTKVVAFDASTDAPENYELLKKSLYDLPVTVLINNVGQSHSIPVPFMETSDEEMAQIITLNNIVTLKVTKIVAPIIEETIAFKKNLHGLILTMGSFAGLVPTPYLSTYSGSKAFLQNWSAALAGELEPKNIDVQLVISYLVTSAMSKIKRSSFTIPTPQQFVSATLKNVGRRVGAQERFATITPYPSHALMHWAIDNFIGVYSKIVNKVNLNMHKSIRTRALKKAARIAAEKKET